MIDLPAAPEAGEACDRSRPTMVIRRVIELPLTKNSLQLSSRLRALALRALGAHVESAVILQPVEARQVPRMLRIVYRSWIGDRVWIHNQDRVDIGSDIVLSQDTLVTTGSNCHRADTGLTTNPVVIEDGAWVTSRCVVLVGHPLVVWPLTEVSGGRTGEHCHERARLHPVEPRLGDVPDGNPRASAQ